MQQEEETDVHEEGYEEQEGVLRPRILEADRRDGPIRGTIVDPAFVPLTCFDALSLSLQEEEQEDSAEDNDEEEEEEEQAV